jgi:hypothetical protein
LLHLLEHALQPVQRDRAVQRPVGRVDAGVELVQVPAQPIVHLRALADQVLALPMVHQQLELPRDVRVLTNRQVWLRQRRPRDRQRVDQIGLASGPGALARAGLASVVGRAVPARPRQAGRAPGALSGAGSPTANTTPKPCSRCAHRSSCRFPATVVRKVRAAPSCRPTSSIPAVQWVSLVDVDATHDHHAGVSSPYRGTVGPGGGHTSVGAQPRC